MCVVPPPGTAVPLLLASWPLLVVAVELPVSVGMPATRFLTRFRLCLAWMAPSAGVQ